MTLLTNVEGSQAVTFDQCTLGLCAVKPTTLWTYRLPRFASIVRAKGNKGRCNHPRGTHQALKSRKADGSFKTAAAKVYPTEMNKAMAAAFIHFAMKLKKVGAPIAYPANIADLGEHFVPTCEEKLAAMESNTIQPDYSGAPYAE